MGLAIVFSGSLVPMRRAKTVASVLAQFQGTVSGWVWGLLAARAQTRAQRTFSFDELWAGINDWPLILDSSKRLMLRS